MPGQSLIDECVTRKQDFIRGPVLANDVREKGNSLFDYVFYVPTLGVGQQKIFGCSLEVIGNEECWFGTSVALDDKLPNIPIVPQINDGIIDEWILVLSFWYI